MTYTRFKRVLDVVFALSLLTLGMPLWVIIAVGVKLSSRGPVLFTQERAGLHATSFRLYKFRSMREGDPGDGFTSGDDARITPFGALLRRWSLDEVPQLLNIVRGEMSFIGPRPTLVDQVQFYTARQMMRLDVRPGLTGLAQVSGRNSLSWAQRMDIDVRYVERQSVVMDLQILIRTIPAALSSSGLYGAEGNVPYRG